MHETIPSPQDTLILLSVLGPTFILLAVPMASITLGTLGADLNAMRAIAEHGREPDRGYARAILALRGTYGNWLGCTLMLVHVLLTSVLSECARQLMPKEASVVVAVVVIYILHEVVPRYLTAQHSLFIGAHSKWIVICFMFLLSPISWPMGWCLDLCGVDGQAFISNPYFKSYDAVYLPERGTL